MKLLITMHQKRKKVIIIIIIKRVVTFLIYMKMISYKKDSNMHLLSDSVTQGIFDKLMYTIRSHFPYLPQYV